MLFRWDAPCAVDMVRWQDELDRLAPRTDRGPSWLKLVWLAGDNWTPHHSVQRWVIYQMVPAHRAPLSIWDELRGPNPRRFGKWDRIEQRFVRSRMLLINREQWELYRQTGCWGKLYWVVQGPAGGHRRQWDDRESRISQALGGDDQPPPPGELPYQPMSQAVIMRLREHDLLLRYDKLKNFMQRDLDIDDLERERAFRKELFHLQTEQIMDTMTFTYPQIDAIRDQWRRIGTSTHEAPGSDDVTDLEQLEYEYIHAEG